MIRTLALTVASALALMLPLGSQAAAPASAPHKGPDAFAEAEKAARKGPADIELAGQAVLHLPAGHQWIPQPQATQLLQAMGNPGKDTRLQGLVFPTDGQQWFMPVRFEAAGYVKDDDARDWKADELLKSYREGTEASNEERVKLGVTPIEVIGWVEQPAYDAGAHRLVWAMSSREKNAPADASQGVNYNTYALGREGYFSLNLVTGLSELPQHKPAAQAMLAALEYKDGKRYADFDAKTDHVAEYGLAALVLGGVAAKKLGFLALAGVFFAKFAKVILLGLAVVGGLGVKLFKRKRAA
ncbi:DUF2167 domain-containing protein [Aquabacterium sp.]|uniref:DUF2167 domain-containing protein n=1 Tax=Aquabacterium sp. TaxID=1872578 RepID=UPI002C570B0D|nr:DUF2167 domain-containing protein [Aquabacterium sp.]HSW05614.1 DUF2167 domain-containing protein [Aquabacterium sp.]